MNPKQFLQIGGVALLLVGILGFIGVIGPGAADSPFGETWYFDNGENWAHTVLGVVAIVASITLGAAAQRTLVLILGVVGVLVGLYSIFQSSFLGSQLQNPADTLLHLVIGAWALFASLRTPRPMMAG